MFDAFEEFDCDMGYGGNHARQCEALEAFGADRIMWGSDFPVVSSREGYDNSLRLPLAYFARLSEDERDAIFGGTAMRVWRFEP